MEKNYEGIARLSELQPRNSLKRRQLELIGAGVKQFREGCDRRANLAREKFLQETKARWIALGSIKEDWHLEVSVGTRDLSKQFLEIVAFDSVL